MRRAGFLAVALCAALAAPAFAADAADGFNVVRSQHFTVHYRGAFAPAGVLNVLEGLHSKLLLDLSPFAPWARDGMLDVYLYPDADAYHQATGSPPWAGGHVVVGTRTIHVFEGETFQRTLAHEMAHLFFEDYFAAGQNAPPTWLNEGVATLMEWNYGLGDEQAVAENRLRRDEAAPLGEFLAFDYHDGGKPGRAVNLWYRQAGSLTAFLMRDMPSMQFVTFCDGLRKGDGVDAALARAYRLQIPDAATLERVWRERLGD